MATDVDFITKLHAYNDIRSFLTQETNDKLIDELHIQDDIDRRIAGLNCEHEFALISYFSEKFEYILGFDESFSKLMDTKTPDFLLKDKSGKKYFVEVKSTDLSKFNGITSNSLAKRKALADELGAEWYLALKIYGRWSLFDYNTFVSKNRKIESMQDFNDSVFMSFFGFNYYVVQNKIIAESIFSKKSEERDCIRHHDYGVLVDYVLKTESENLIEDSSKESSIFVEILHNFFAEKKEEKVDEDKTKLVERLGKDILVSTDECMMASIMHSVSKFGTLNDAKTFFDDFINHRSPSSRISAYNLFWKNMIDKCKNNEIFVPEVVSFCSDGTFHAEGGAG